MRTGGGGGWGDPLERDPERVRWDVLEEFVSREAARDAVRRGARGRSLRRRRRDARAASKARSDGSSSGSALTPSAATDRAFPTRCARPCGCISSTRSAPGSPAARSRKGAPCCASRRNGTRPETDMLGRVALGCARAPERNRRHPSVLGDHARRAIVVPAALTIGAALRDRAGAAVADARSRSGYDLVTRLGAALGRADDSLSRHLADLLRGAVRGRRRSPRASSGSTAGRRRTRSRSRWRIASPVGRAPERREHVALARDRQRCARRRRRGARRAGGIHRRPAPLRGRFLSGVYHASRPTSDALVGSADERPPLTADELQALVRGEADHGARRRRRARSSRRACRPRRCRS